MKTIKLSSEKKLAFGLFLCIPAALFLIMVVYPALKSMCLSLYKWDGISPVRVYVGLDNYRRLFTNPRLWLALKNNLIWLIAALVFPTGLGLGMALLLDQKTKGEGVFQILFFIPYIITPVAVASIWRWLYEPSGFINGLLTKMGLSNYVKVWLGDPKIATYALIFAYIWWTAGFPLVVYVAGLRSIPREMQEAAEIDGANFVQKFIAVTWPQLQPSTIVIMGLSAISAVRVFDLIQAATQGGPGYTTDVLATMMYDISFARFNMGQGTALAVILFVLAAIVTLPYIYYSSRDLEGIRY